MAQLRHAPATVSPVAGAKGLLRRHLVVMRVARARPLTRCLARVALMPHFRRIPRLSMIRSRTT